MANPIVSLKTTESEHLKPRETQGELDPQLSKIGAVAQNSMMSDFNNETTQEQKKVETVQAESNETVKEETSRPLANLQPPPSSNSSDSKKSKKEDKKQIPPSHSSQPAPALLQSKAPESINVNKTEGEEESEGVKPVLSFIKKGTTANDLKDDIAQVKKGKEICLREIATQYYAPAMALDCNHRDRKTVIDALNLLKNEKFSRTSKNSFFVYLNYYVEVKDCPNVDINYCATEANKYFSGLDDESDQLKFNAKLARVCEQSELYDLLKVVHFLQDSGSKTKMERAVRTRLRELKEENCVANISPEVENLSKLGGENEAKKGGGTPKGSSWMPSSYIMLLGVIALGGLAYWKWDTIVNGLQGRKVNKR